MNRKEKEEKKLKQKIAANVNAKMLELREKGAFEQISLDALDNFDVQTPAKKASTKKPSAKKPTKKPTAKKPKKQAKKAPKQDAHDKLELIFTIVAWNKADFYVDLLESFEVNIQLVIQGAGTASASTLALFGLTDSSKAVIVGVIKENKIKDALDTLEEKFQTVRNGKGIAYTVPMSGIIGTLIYGFLSNNKLAVKQDGVKS
ncbi:MAG: hypothetical protein J1G38_01430 [Clostridiales bacterium]|nr:hypothetical protein [Clostridiales bacterium]